ncbi:MAG TPA: serine/threonine-protein kinase [Thermoanaerobaculia bacterium]
MNLPRPELFQRARARFEELIEESGAERQAHLEALAASDPELAAAVADLLAADARASGFLDRPAVPTAVQQWLAASARETALGQTIGPYRTVALLGRGGMGEVFLAERADGQFDQKVALKVLRRGMDSDEILRRFLRERQLLARLEHPHIARLLDGGRAPDGRPFIVMERVEGEPITLWCESHRSTVEERLRLAITCCEAVEVAHRNLIVHRDLKPSNVLVSAGGEVKLLDFGIAKLLGEDGEETLLTRADVHVLTPAYAAPEQILGGPVTTATDVYALGVVLYELLTGALPHDRRATTGAELAAKVSRETVERPSAAARKAVEAETDVEDRRRRRLSRRLQGDLDTILLKALHRDPARRYASAAALADDLRRHLEGKPVSARPDTWGYRAAKLAERHRWGVAAAALIALSLVAGLAAALWQARVARAQAQRAEEAQQFLTSIFRIADPDQSKGAQLTARDLLDSGAARVDDELADQPELHAEMLKVLGNVYFQLALYPEALKLYEKALAIRRTLSDEPSWELAESYRRVGLTLHKTAEYAQARPFLERALAMHESRRDEIAMASTLNDLGNLSRAEGDLAGAQRLLERAVTLRSRGEPLDSPELAKYLNNLALALQRQRKYPEAARVYERALAIHRKNEGELSSLVAGTEDNLAMVLNETGDLAGARAHNQTALAIAERLYDRPHPNLALFLNTAGYLAAQRDAHAEAIRYYERALEVYGQTLGLDHPDAAYTLQNLGRERALAGDAKAALALHQRALRIREKAYGPNHLNVATSLHDMANAYRLLGDYAAAEAALRQSAAVFRDKAGPQDARTAGVLFDLGEILILRGRRKEAAAALQESLSIQRARLPAGDPEIAKIEAALARARGGKGVAAPSKPS